MKRLWKIIGTVVFIVSLVYFGIVITRQASALGAYQLTEDMVPSVVWATLLYAGLLGVFSLCWVLLLKGVGAHIRYADATIILGISQIAKYLPGNVGHHIGRVVLGKQYNLSMPAMLFSIMLEGIWSTAVAVLLALLGLLTLSDNVQALAPQIPSAWKIGAILVGLIATPYILAWALRHLRLEFLQKLIGDHHISIPGSGIFFQCLIFYGIAFLGLGLIIDLLAQGLFSVSARHYWLLTGAFAIAWVAGFISPGVPAGLGVREAVLIAILGPVLGEAPALGISVALRAVTTVGDGLVFILALAGRRFIRPG